MRRIWRSSGLESKAKMPYHDPMSTTLTVTAKGQVTLKKEILEHLGVSPGEKIVLDKLPDGKFQMRAKPTGKISDAFGVLKPPPGVHFTIEEIEDAIRRAWAGDR